MINLITKKQIKYVSLCFAISLDKTDKTLLEMIQLFFGVGKISKNGDNLLFRVRSVTELAIIINHFEKYPLITQKWSDYQLFKQAYMLISKKEHLTLKGIQKIITLRATINEGLTHELKIEYPNIIPISRPKLENQSIKDPHWLAGFINAEGCFFIDIQNSDAYSTGRSVQLRLKVSQHIRDKNLMSSFIVYLNCGLYYRLGERDAGEFRVTKFIDIYNIIIPFLKKYPIFGYKLLNFEDFCRIAHLMKDKQHLTTEGLKFIINIKNKMNTKRI